MADDDYYDEEEATPEEKLKIATHFVLKSPNGEVNDVVNDLRKLLDDPNILNDDVVHKILRQYNTDQLFFAPDENGHQVVISDIAQKDSSHYIDPETRRVLRFDHVSKKLSDPQSVESKVDDRIDAYREAIQNGFQKYGEETFTEDKYAYAVHANQSGLITMIMTAKNMNLSNYWSGGWRSLYTVNVSSKGSKDLNGIVKLNVHYFEDGNVQLTTEFKSKVSVKIDADPDTTGETVAKAVDQIESEFQKNLEEFYVDIHDNAFKAMRRFLPKTRKKMTWKIHGHSLAEEVGS